MFWDLDLIEGIKTLEYFDKSASNCLFWDLDLIEGIKTRASILIGQSFSVLFWDLDLIEGIKTCSDADFLTRSNSFEI